MTNSLVNLLSVTPVANHLDESSWAPECAVLIPTDNFVKKGCLFQTWVSTKVILLAVFCHFSFSVKGLVSVPFIATSWIPQHSSSRTGYLSAMLWTTGMMVVQHQMTTCLTQVPRIRPLNLDDLRALRDFQPTHPANRWLTHVSVLLLQQDWPRVNFIYQLNSFTRIPPSTGLYTSKKHPIISTRFATLEASVTKDWVHATEYGFLRGTHKSLPDESGVLR